MEMIRVSVTTTRTEPPAIRNERLDWHALTNEEQHQVLAWKGGHFDLDMCRVRAKKYLERHCGA
jgi:hypothetical protein